MRGNQNHQVFTPILTYPVEGKGFLRRRQFDFGD